MKIYIFLENSKVFQFILTICFCYKKTVGKLNRLYALYNKLENRCEVRVMDAFRYSVFGRITEINEYENRDVLSHSVVVNKFMTIYERFIWKLSLYFKESKLSGLVEELSGNILESPLKTGGLIGIIAIAVNFTLIVVFEKEMYTFGAVFRAVLFLIALVCAFSHADWKSVKTGSYILRNYMCDYKKDR